MAGPSYPVGQPAAKVTTDVAEASRCVSDGTPTVLVSEDGAAVGRALRSSPDEGARERLLGVLIGDPDDPAVRAAAEEMAGELWPWAAAMQPGVVTIDIGEIPTKGS